MFGGGATSGVRKKRGQGDFPKRFRGRKEVSGSCLRFLTNLFFKVSVLVLNLFATA